MDGEWSTAGNWSNGVPTSTSVACITMDGTYTVLANEGSNTAASLKLGGASGTQTLRIDGQAFAFHGLLTLTNQDVDQGVLANGRIQLGGTADTAGRIAVSAGTLTNKGTVTAAAPSNGTNRVDGTFDNQGTLTINDGFGSVAPSTWTTSGTVTVASGKTVTLDWTGVSSSLTQTGGTISNSGTLLQKGGKFTANGSGTATGTPLRFEGAVSLTPSGSGSGAFDVVSETAVLDSNIGAGYKVHVDGLPFSFHGILTLNASRTNSGSIQLGGTADTAGRIAVASGTLTNTGAMTAAAPSNGTNRVDGNFDNQGSLTIDDGFQSVGTSVWTTSGTVTVASGKTVTLDWNASSSLTQTAGTISNSGTLLQKGGSFTANGSGTATGTPLRFEGL